MFKICASGITSSNSNLTIGKGYDTCDIGYQFIVNPKSKMGKRKLVNINRFKWMNEGKKRAKEEAEQVQEIEEEIAEEHHEIEEEIEEELQQVNGDAEIENEEPNQYVEHTLDEDGVAPAIIFIDGVPVPTRDLADPRNGDGMVIELDADGDSYLAPFNGDYHDLHQVVSAIWENQNGEGQITVGHTNRHPKQWATSAYSSGLRFVARPTMRTTTCRCLIDAIKAGFFMKVSETFSFKIFVRTALLAEKVKGLVRQATACIHKGEAVDDTNSLVPLHNYIERKLFNAIEHLPQKNRTAVCNYLRRKGWQID